MLRLSDDFVLFQRMKEDLRNILQEMVILLQDKFKLKINMRKTKVMISREQKHTDPLTVKICSDVAVKKFYNLGNRMTKVG